MIDVRVPTNPPLRTCGPMSVFCACREGSPMSMNSNRRLLMFVHKRLNRPF
jgi:hypothetical protein